MTHLEQVKKARTYAASLTHAQAQAELERVKTLHENEEDEQKADEYFVLRLELANRVRQDNAASTELPILPETVKLGLQTE